MYRAFLISLFHLCFHAFGLQSDYDSSSNEEGPQGREINNGDFNEERVALLSLDYYNNGGDEFRNDLSRETLLKKADSHDEDYEVDPASNIVVLDSQDARNYKAELLAGNKADLLNANPNHFQPDTYPDFGRRLSEPTFIDITRSSNHEPVPVWAPPEMVIAIAKESALINAAESNPTNKPIQKDILRTGKYWNAFWTEEVNPQILREKTNNHLDTMKIQIKPQSPLYDLILKLKQLSPTLLYVINK